MQLGSTCFFRLALLFYSGALLQFFILHFYSAFLLLFQYPDSKDSFRLYYLGFLLYLCWLKQCQNFIECYLTYSSNHFKDSLFLAFTLLKNSWVFIKPQSNFPPQGLHLCNLLQKVSNQQLYRLLWLSCICLKSYLVTFGQSVRVLNLIRVSLQLLGLFPKFWP